jgi:hypothetical protein
MDKNAMINNSTKPTKVLNKRSKKLVEKQRGQVFILDIYICFSNRSIFFFNFLSFSIFCATRRQDCDTPDSPMPNCKPISFNFLLVYFWQRYIFRFLAKASSCGKADSTFSNMSCMDAFLTNSFRAGSSLSGFLADIKLSLIYAIKSALPSKVELTTCSSGLSYSSKTSAFTNSWYPFWALDTFLPK